MPTNYDTLTGCHYGCISYHSLNQEALQDVFDKGENLTHANAVAEAKASLRACLGEWMSDWKHGGKGTSRLDDVVEECWDVIEQDFNDSYQGEDEQYLYVGDGYKISNSPSLVCLFIEESPYYTFTRECSPCAPNAGDLDTPAEGGLKAYCLGPDWFDDEKPPYVVYRVSDGTVLGAEV